MRRSCSDVALNIKTLMDAGNQGILAVYIEAETKKEEKTKKIKMYVNANMLKNWRAKEHVKCAISQNPCFDVVQEHVIKYVMRIWLIQQCVNFRAVAKF